MVVADVDRAPAEEGRLAQEVTHRAALVHRAGQRLHHLLALLQAQAGRSGHGFGQRMAAQRREIGCLAVVQRDGPALELDPQRGVPRGQGGGGGGDVGERGIGRGQPRQAAGGVAPLGAMHAGGRQAQRREQGIELADRTAGYQRERAAQAGGQQGQAVHQAGGHAHRLGRRGDVHQGAVEVQEQRRVAGKGDRKHHGLRL